MRHSQDFSEVITHWFDSPREAIECYKRALISSDVNESVLCLKLARLHLMLDEKAEAAAYHRRVVEYCQDKSGSISAIEVYLGLTPHVLQTDRSQSMQSRVWRLPSTTSLCSMEIWAWRKVFWTR